MTTTMNEPWRWGYPVAIALLLLGCAGFAGFFLMLFSGLSGIGSSLTQVVVPGGQDLALKAGNYTIFHEYQSQVGNQVFSTPQGIGGLRCTVTHKESGEEIPLQATSASGTYTLGNRSGRAVWNFAVRQPGTYTVAADYGTTGSGPSTVLAVGSGFTGRLMGTIFGSFALMSTAIMSALAGAVIGIITFVKRRAT